MVEASFDIWGFARPAQMDFLYNEGNNGIVLHIRYDDGVDVAWNLNTAEVAPYNVTLLMESLATDNRVLIAEEL